MAVSKRRVWIVLLNWKGADDTISCIDSLLAMGETGWRLAVCDNASPDDSLPRLRTALRDRFGDDWTELSEADVTEAAVATRTVLIRNASNHGYAGGNNVGLHLALRDPAMTHCWVLNNDTEVAPDALSQVLSHAAAHPDQGIIGATLAYHDRPGIMQAAGGAQYNRWTGMVRLIGHAQPVADAARFAGTRLDFVVGAAMLISRPWLEQVGLMDASYFLYLEEVDYCRKGRGRFALGYAPGAIVYHKEGGSTGGKRQDISLLADFYNIRNRLRITWRHFPYAMPTVMGGLLITVANRMRRGQWDRIGMVFRIAFNFRRIDYKDLP